MRKSKGNVKMNDALQLKSTRYELILTLLGICLFTVGIFLSNSAPWWIPGCSKAPHHWYYRWNSMLCYVLLPTMWYVPVRLSFCRYYLLWTGRWGITTLSLIPYGHKTALWLGNPAKLVGDFADHIAGNLFYHRNVLFAILLKIVMNKEI